MIEISIINCNDEIIDTNSGENNATLFLEHTYEAGDRIHIHFDELDKFYKVNLDDAVGEGFVYIKGDIDYVIPFDEKHFSYSPRAFMGDKHLITVTRANDMEIAGHNLISKNPIDYNGNSGAFPHAYANVETRGEANFAARNAIDGIYASVGHWGWPFASWGINRDPNAAWTLDFGRKVEIDRIVIFERCDFPHDAWWEQASLVFSDGTEETVKLVKTEEGQAFDIHKGNIEWIRLERLIKADDPSEFPALTQLEVWGK